MDGLFDRNRDFNDSIIRNIVSLRESQDLFDDLVDAQDEHDILIAAEMRIKSHAPPGMIQRGFHYSTAIEYPFKTEPFMASRYGDGSYPVWYGALDLETTIYETAWHFKNEILGIAAVDEAVIRERAVYYVDCKAVLIDISEKGYEYPDLIENDYGYCQQTGRRVQNEGHPGLLVPSARNRGGINAVIFRETVLDNPVLHCYLSYFFDPNQSEVRIERDPGTALTIISY